MKTNNIISAFGRLSDRVELSVSPNADLYTDETNPVPRKAGERFMSAAKMLSVSEYLCFQLEADGAGELRAFAYATADRAVTTAVCQIAAGHPENGNGRFCRNLAEIAILNYASRVYGSEDSSAEKDYTLYPCDLKIPEQTDSQLEDHMHIGFVA